MGEIRQKMIRIKKKNNMTFVGVADEGHGEFRSCTFARLLLEALAEYFLEYAEKITKTPFRDEIKFELARKIRKAVQGYPVQETRFVGVLLIPGKNILFHVRFGDGGICGAASNNCCKNINWNINMNERALNICEDGCIEMVRIKMEQMDKFKKLYLFARGRDMRFLLFHDGGVVGGCKGYEYSPYQQGQKKEEQWVEQNQCIVRISED